MKKLSTGAKQRMKLYLKYRDISQFEFSKTTGLANGFLQSGNNIGSDNLDIITDKYNDLNLTWLIKGKGHMLKPTQEILDLTESSKLSFLKEPTLESNEFILSETSDLQQHYRELIKTKEEIIFAYQLTIQSKDELIDEKKRKIQELEERVLALEKELSKSRKK